MARGHDYPDDLDQKPAMKAVKFLTIGLGALLALPAATFAQSNQSASTPPVVNSPDLNDFQLRPKAEPRVNEDEPTIRPVRRDPPVVRVAPPPVQAGTAQPQPATQQPAATGQPATRAAPMQQRPSQAAPATNAPAPAANGAAGPATTLPVESGPVVDSSANPLPAPTTTAVPSAAAPAAGQGSGIPWLYIGLGALALLGLGALIAMRRRRARAEDMAAYEIAYEEAYAAPPVEAEPVTPAADQPTPAMDAPAPVAPPVPQPAPVTAAENPRLPVRRRAAKPAEGPRPRIAIKIVPNMAKSSAAEAQIEYVLTLTNVGDAPAHFVRGNAHLFNAGPEQNKQLREFFGQPIPKARPRTLQPGESVEMQQALAMRDDEIRPLLVDGRPWLVPLIGISCRYEWQNGVGIEDGQTAMSYIVGREQASPADKMAPFRLDAGPRVYRRITTHEHTLQQVA